MSISPLSSILAANAVSATPGSAVAQQNALLSTTVSQRTFKDQINLSSEAVALLLGGGKPPAAAG